MNTDQIVQQAIIWITDPGHDALIFLFLAKMLVNGTETPDPATLKGKIYKFLEYAALMFGKAKQTGGQK